MGDDNYIDGAISASFADNINKAKKLGATKIIAIDNINEGWIAVFYLRLYKLFHPILKKINLGSKLTADDSIFLFKSSNKLGALDNNRQHLMEMILIGYNDVFVGTNSTNIIGGKNNPGPNASPPDGDNGRIVLDGLPLSYDFPALLTSVSKILTNNSIGGPAIGGSDQSSAVNSSSSANPSPAKIDLSISGSGGYHSAQTLVKDFERSIRPFDITKLSLSGSESNLAMSIGLSTYYQPAKSLMINSKEVR